MREAPRAAATPARTRSGLDRSDLLYGFSLYTPRARIKSQNGTSSLISQVPLAASPPRMVVRSVYRSDMVSPDTSATADTLKAVTL